jgi:hypothetical protein
MEKAKLGKTWTVPKASGGQKNRQNGTGSIAPGRGQSPGVRTPAK